MLAAVVTLSVICFSKTWGRDEVEAASVTMAVVDDPARDQWAGDQGNERNTYLPTDQAISYSRSNQDGRQESLVVCRIS